MAHKFTLKPSDLERTGVVVVYPVGGNLWEVVHEMRDGQIKVSLVDVYMPNLRDFEFDVVEGPELTDRSVACMIDEILYYRKNV